MSSVEVQESKTVKPDPLVILAGLFLAVAFIATYTYAGKESGSTLWYLWHSWHTDDYQHGYFVLPFCAYLLWSRRDMMTEIPAQGSWWGLAFFAVWAGMRIFGVFLNLAWFQHASIIPGAAAIVLFVGGWQAILWAWPAIVFMVFMIPLPGMATDFLSQPLQSIGSRCSVFIIQTLGISAMRDGNAIKLSKMTQDLNVAEACSGIRMLMLFFALCVGASFLMTKKQWWERLLIVASAIPIAVAANVVRLTLIALFSQLVSTWPSLVNVFLLNLLNDKSSPVWPDDVRFTWVHNLPGYLMMPIGMLFLWLEWTLYTKLFVEEPEDRNAGFRTVTRGLLPMAVPPREGKQP
jgi:exosortase